MISKSFLFAYTLVYSANVGAMTDEEKLLCLGKMINPEQIPTSDVEYCRAAYDELVDKNVRMLWDVKGAFNVSIETVNSMINKLQYDWGFINAQQNAHLKSEAAKDDCGETVYDQGSQPNTLCKIYYYGDTSAKQYTYTHSCCLFKYNRLSPEPSEAKKNAAKKYAMFIVKQKMIEKIASSARAAIDGMLKLMNPDDFTISPS